MRGWASFVAIAVSLASSAQGDWPQWRGADGRGASEVKNLPVEFSPESNLVWKLDLPGRSAATPALVRDRLFLTSPDGADLYFYAVSTDGKVLWRKKIGTGDRRLGFNSKNNLASPSPVSDGEHVWVMVGSGDIACFDFNGNEVWHRNTAKDHGPITNDFGLASSPLLWKDRLLVSCIHRRAESYVLAIDKLTGKELWKTFRPTDAQEESRDAYSSPAIYDPPGGRPELILVGGDMVTAQDPMTGAELWRHGEINLKGDKTLRIVVSPVAGDGLIYATSAKRGPVHAIKPGGSGDVTKSQRAWTRREHTPDVATPVVAGDLFFMVQENGVASCLDAKTGKEHWSRRIGTGFFFSSPLVADGKLYVANEAGKVFVLAATPEFKALATNDVGDVCLASPVPGPGRLYFRTEHALLCFGK